MKSQTEDLFKIAIVIKVLYFKNKNDENWLIIHNKNRNVINDNNSALIECKYIIYWSTISNKQWIWN